MTTTEVTGVSRTYLVEFPDGRLLEYRRVFRAGRDDIVDLEHRELRRDGMPHDDCWYTVSDEGLVWIQGIGTDVVDQLCYELPL